MPTSAINTDALAAAIRLCFEKARDNATYSEEQCAEFLFQGKRLRGLLVNLISATFTAPTPEVDAVNQALDDLVARLDDNAAALEHYADTIKKIEELVGALDGVLKFAVAL